MSSDNSFIPESGVDNFGASHSQVEFQANVRLAQDSIPLVSEISEKPSFPLEDFTYDKINQSSKIGDCYFLAGLASLAATDSGPQKLQDMIAENEDGSYTVTFPGEKDKPVHVTEEDIESSGVDNDARWADVLEAGYLKLSHSKPWADWVKVEGLGLFSSIKFRETMELLTGEPVSSSQFSFFDIGSGNLTVGITSKENAREDLQEAVEKGKIVTAFVAPKYLTPVGMNSGANLPGLHVFSVLDYDTENQIVTLRNPWKHMAGTELSGTGSEVDGITHLGKGVITMPFDTLYTQFNGMSMSGKGETRRLLEHAVDDIVDIPIDIKNGVSDLISFKPLDAWEHLKELKRDSVDHLNNTAKIFLRIPKIF